MKQIIPMASRQVYPFATLQICCQLHQTMKNGFEIRNLVIIGDRRATASLTTTGAIVLFVAITKSNLCLLPLFGKEGNS